MKRYVIIIIFLMPLIAGAQVLSLDSCLNLAEKNYPLLDKAELLRQSESLNNKISSVANYPSVKLNAQASWQTSVTQVSIDNPMFADLLPEMSKDQYKIYAEFNQSIWDGGMLNARKDLERATLNSGLSQIEAELFSHKERILNIFFAALSMQKQIEILDMKKWQIDNVIGDLRVALANNIVMQSQIDILLAEKMILDQNIIELNYETSYLVKMLSVYCGKDFDEHVTFLVPTPILNTSKLIDRPETHYFESQQMQIMASKGIIETSRMPKVYAFAQAGYGRPGLNMLSNEFEPYAIVGAKLVWTPWEWNKSKNEIDLIQVKSDIVANAKDNFIMSQNALLEAQYQRIEKLKLLSEKDLELLELRESITKSYLAQLNGGVIKSTDYLNVLNDENSQRLKIELHELMLYEAIVKYNLIKGEIYGGK
jgi:outer membrane protein TolC